MEQQQCIQLYNVVKEFLIKINIGDFVKTFGHVINQMVIYDTQSNFSSARYSEKGVKGVNQRFHTLHVRTSTW